MLRVRVRVNPKHIRNVCIKLSVNNYINIHCINNIHCLSTYLILCLLVKKYHISFKSYPIFFWFYFKHTIHIKYNELTYSQHDIYIKLPMNNYIWFTVLTTFNFYLHISFFIIYIYIYISERIKEDALILCYSEFQA